MHRMHPALAHDPDRGPAVVWHIAVADSAEMMCGTLTPATEAPTEWSDISERPCASCQLAYRQLLAGRTA